MTMHVDCGCHGQSRRHAQGGVAAAAGGSSSSGVQSGARVLASGAAATYIRAHYFPQSYKMIPGTTAARVLKLAVS